MRFEVPQFIEVEDKIIGPLTWKQFVYLAGGAGILVVLFLLLPFILFAVIGLPIGALAAFLSFHKVNSRPFSAFLESFLTYSTKSKLYLWRKTEQQIITTHTLHTAALPETQLPRAKSGISELSRKLELNTVVKQQYEK